jgi:hypothetical protein
MQIKARRMWWLVAAGSALAAAVALAAPASAYQLQDATDTSGNVLCTPKKFASGAAARVIVHTAESQATTSQINAVVDAIEDVSATIGKVGGSTANVTSVTTSTTPFTFQNFYGDTTPTIHIGFAGNRPASELGNTTYGTTNTSSCTYNESQIVLRDFNSVSGSGGTFWDSGTPGTDYYDADPQDSAGTYYLRPVILHEMLHAFGLHHSGNTYAMMNYVTKPWGNRPDADAMQPLPDDASGLRDLYPSSSTRIDVGVLDTWYVPNSDPRSPATGTKLCEPSLGTGVSSDKFGQYCGANAPTTAPTTVCENDMLRVWYTVANYSTYDAIVTKELFFSNDETFGLSEPDSFSAYTGTIKAGASKSYGMTFKVPKLSGASGTTMHLIARVVSQSDKDGDGYTEADTVRSEWIPLRGTITLC